MKFFTVATLFAAVAIAAPSTETVENDKRSDETLDKRNGCWDEYYGPGHRFGRGFGFGHGGFGRGGFRLGGFGRGRHGGFGGGFGGGRGHGGRGHRRA